MKEEVGEASISILDTDLTEWGKACTIERCSQEVRARLAWVAARKVSSKIYGYDRGLSAEYRQREAAWCRIEEYMIANTPASTEAEAKKYKRKLLVAANPVAYLQRIFCTVAKRIVAETSSGIRNKDGSLSKRFTEFSGDAEIYEGVSFFDKLVQEDGQNTRAFGLTDDDGWEERAAEKRGSNALIDASDSVDEDEFEAELSHVESEDALAAQQSEERRIGVFDNQKPEIDSIYVEPELDDDAEKCKSEAELKADSIWEKADTDDRYLLLLLCHGLSRREIAASGLLTVKQSALYARFDRIKSLLMGENTDSPYRAAYLARAILLSLQKLALEWMGTLENLEEIHLVIQERS